MNSPECLSKWAISSAGHPAHPPAGHPAHHPADQRCPKLDEAGTLSRTGVCNDYSVKDFLDAWLKGGSILLTMKKVLLISALYAGFALAARIALAADTPTKTDPKKEEADALLACAKAVFSGIRPIAATRDVRFEGKVSEANALCRGGYKSEQFRLTPWVDWGSYWGTGDMSSLPSGFLTNKGPEFRGVNGALIDLEFERVELIKFNLFDNAGTYQEFIQGRGGANGPALKTWPSMRLPATDPNYAAVGGDGPQVCKGELVRGRTLTGICNDVKNPRMGSVGTPFARNVEFETSFPELEQTELTKNRHGGRLSLLEPDPQVISRTLFTRQQTAGNNCNGGF